VSVQLRIAQHQMQELHTHLFPGDGDEHGAVIAASVLETPRGVRLLAHRLFLARDGIDYVPGERGYRMLTAEFVMDCVLECADLKMAYVAVHCHGGSDTVAFSKTDMESHERGYPALRDILEGRPVGGLVFARHAVAGDIWLAEGQRVPLEVLVVAGHPIDELRAAPFTASARAGEMFDRQSRLFGDRGQAILGRQKVGVIGAGGAGSIVLEQLARLGVGEVVVIDPDRIEPSNLSRVVGSRRRDTLPGLTNPKLGSLARWATRHRRSKVSIARRAMRAANARIRVTSHCDNVVEAAPVRDLIDCDYLLLAADSMQARHVFNALVHQYLIPGGQMGVKAQVRKQDGSIVDLFVVYRAVIPGEGCLWCNGLILPDQLQREATEADQLRRQRYVGDDDVPAPSVITLNGIAASLATSDYLMSVTGLAEPSELTWTRHDPRTGEFVEEVPRVDQWCYECSTSGRLGRGPTRRLPTTVR
jgi:hypothetical protein